MIRAGFALVAVLDYELTRACFRIIHGIGFMPKHLVTLEQRPMALTSSASIDLQTALRFGTGLNVYLEDDTLRSPDLLNLVNWWSEQKISGDSLTCFTFIRIRKNHQECRVDGRFSCVGMDSEAKSELRWLQ
jgi:hypothetical protein